MDVVVVEQQPDAPAGHVESWAAAHGLAQAVVRVHAGDPWPRADEAGRIVVLGSEHSVHADPPAWVDRELAFIREAVEAGVPVLGLCFGGQALAAALGGRVLRAARPEIGWVDVQGEDGVSGPWFAWHFDAFELPPGARALGRTDAALQAFAHGPHLGLQFHPEVTTAIVEDWIDTGRGTLDEHRLAADAMRERTLAEADSARARAHALFDVWVALR